MKTRINAPTLHQISKLYGMVFRKTTRHELRGASATCTHTYQTIKGENKPETLSAFNTKNKARTLTRAAFNEHQKPL